MRGETTLLLCAADREARLRMMFWHRLIKRAPREMWTELLDEQAPVETWAAKWNIWAPWLVARAKEWQEGAGSGQLMVGSLTVIQAPPAPRGTPPKWVPGVESRPAYRRRVDAYLRAESAAMRAAGYRPWAPPNRAHFDWLIARLLPPPHRQSFDALDAHSPDAARKAVMRVARELGVPLRRPRQQPLITKAHLRLVSRR